MYGLLSRCRQLDGGSTREPCAPRPSACRCLSVPPTFPRGLQANTCACVILHSSSSISKVVREDFTSGLFLLLFFVVFLPFSECNNNGKLFSLPLFDFKYFARNAVTRPQRNAYVTEVNFLTPWASSDKRRLWHLDHICIKTWSGL